jgi:SAM-dependent methyltransferase
MHQFDSDVTARFFNDIFARSDAETTSTPETRLRSRDKLLLSHVLEPRRHKAPRIIDFGCGQGRLLGHIIASGFDAIGMEKHEGMRNAAEAELAAAGSGDRILKGGVDEFAALPSASFDIVIMMGVLQYLSDDDYRKVTKAISRVLKPNGCFAATFQNAFFDLYTFNKYTMDFFIHQLVGPLVEPSQQKAVEKSLSELIANPDKPPYSPDRARDNVFVRLTNPLLLGDEFRSHGLELKEKYFYDFFGLPPLLQKHQAIAQGIASHFELERATAWHGYFMANAFLAEFESQSTLRTA